MQHEISENYRRALALLTAAVCTAYAQLCERHGKSRHMAVLLSSVVLGWQLDERQRFYAMRAEAVAAAEALFPGVVEFEDREALRAMMDGVDHASEYAL